jgi:hypothetical protein
MITCHELSPGKHECVQDLSMLYPSEIDRRSFEQKWDAFRSSDPDNPKIFTRIGNDKLTYLTESFIPILKDDRPPLLILLGNPASHSVKAGICFAYEGNYREHRFWRVMRETRILDFNLNGYTDNNSWEYLAQERHTRLFSLQYNSPFRIGIDVFFSIPSTASTPKWSGVAGLQRLFGSQALRRIALTEEKRLARILERFLPNKGYILAFQKDAYEGLRSADDPPYSLTQAKEGRLTGHCKFNTAVRVIGCPPTRLINSNQAKNLLLNIRNSVGRS